MAESTENVFGINFDSSKFISSVEDALSALKKFEGEGEQFELAFKLLAKQVDSVSFTKPVTEIDKLRKVMAQFKQEGGKLDLKQFDKAVNEMMKDLPKVQAFIKQLKAEMKGMDQSSDAFKELNAYVNNLEVSISSLKDEVKDTDTNGFVPLRKRLKDLKIAMQELEDAGQENTQQYQVMQREAAKLTDQLGDQAEAVQRLASDTFALDAAVDTMQNLTAAFQVYEGVMALTGESNEDLQRSMQKLMALMNVANGLQQINNFLTGQSAAKLAITTTWNKLYAVSLRLTATSTATATLATRAFSAALAAIPIVAIVAGLGLLINYFMNMGSAAEEAAKDIDRLNTGFADLKESQERYLRSVEREGEAALSTLEAQGASEAELAAQRQKNAKQQILATKEVQAATIAYYNSSKDAEIASIQSRADAFAVLAKAQNAANKKNVSDAEKQVFDGRIKAANAIIETYDRVGEAEVRLTEETNKETARRLQLQRDYFDELQKLRNRAQDLLDEAGPQSDQKIKDKYARDFKIEEKELRKKYKDLGKAQVDAIVKQAKQISDLERDAARKEFGEQQKAAALQAARETQDLQEQIVDANIALIKDENERELEAIRNAEADKLRELERLAEDRKKALKEQRDSGLISEEQYQNELAKLEQYGTDRRAQIRKETDDAQLKQAETRANRLVALAEQIGNLTNSAFSEAESEAIKKQSELLAQGKINYTQYTEAVAKIQRDSNKKLLRAQLKDLETLLIAQQQAVTEATTESGKNQAQISVNKTREDINKIKALINEEGRKLEGIDNFIAKALGVDSDDPQAQSRINKFKAAVSEAIGEITSLAQQTAARQVEAADEAVESQQRRVDAAVKIAEEGNAEYLRQEEDRLRELEIKREQAARKQLALDAAVQASQILVAIAAAAADAFKSNQGKIGVATNIATIVAALASGAALVKSLQSSAPRLAEGTDYVSRGTNPVGRDTIPAMLDEGEAVISARTNKKYGPTIRAIRRGLLPEDVLNGFVKDYTKGVAYNQLGEAVKNNGVSHFIEMNGRLQRLENVMAVTAEAIQGLGVNVKLDQDGFAASINTHLSRRNKIFKA
jgi:hypothetical protein